MEQLKNLIRWIKGPTAEELVRIGLENYKKYMEIEMGWPPGSYYERLRNHYGTKP